MSIWSVLDSWYKREPNQDVVTLDGKEVLLSESIKYLGLVFERNEDIDKDVTHVLCGSSRYNCVGRF